MLEKATPGAITAAASKRLVCVVLRVDIHEIGFQADG